MLETADTSALLRILQWHRDCGVDAAVGLEAVDWLARPERPPGTGIDLRATASAPPPPAASAVTSAPAMTPRTPAATRPSPAAPASRPPIAPAPSIVAPSRQFSTTPPDAAETAARTLARAAKDLDALRAALAGFDGCALKATAKSLCFYRGAPDAPVMIIGEAPGRDEDHEGRPFVGRAGQLLDRMLASIGLDETSVHITNVVYWRPPGNRTPTPQETQICRPFLERQIELVAPEALLLLGGPAMKAILDLPDGIMKVRGKWKDVTVGSHRTRALPTLHPAYLLRSPAAKRQAWRDLLSLRAMLDGATQ